MKKNTNMLIVTVCLMALLFSSVSELRAQLSGKVLFVTIVATARDSMVRQHFTDWGLTYDLMDIAAFKASVPADTTLAKYKFVYISEACKSADLNNARGLNAPIFTHKSYMAPKAVAGYCAGAAANVLTTGDVEIMDGTHTLAGGYNTGDTVKLVTGTSATKYINYFPKDPLVSMINIAKVKGDAANSQLVVIGIEKGTLVYANGTELSPTLPLKARVAIVGINSEANAYMTEGAWKLTKAGVEWVLANPSSMNDRAATVDGYSLYQNYPNPFNPSTRISYSLPQASTVKLQVYAANGQLLRTLTENMESAGMHSVEFNANDLSTGIYFYRLTANNHVLNGKMLLLK